MFNEQLFCKRNQWVLIYTMYSACLFTFIFLWFKASFETHTKAPKALISLKLVSVQNNLTVNCNFCWYFWISFDFSYCSCHNLPLSNINFVYKYVVSYINWSVANYQTLTVSLCYNFSLIQLYALRLLQISHVYSFVCFIHRIRYKSKHLKTWIVWINRMDLQNEGYKPSDILNYMISHFLWLGCPSVQHINKTLIHSLRNIKLKFSIAD